MGKKIGWVLTSGLGNLLLPQHIPLDHGEFERISFLAKLKSIKRKIVIFAIWRTGKGWKKMSVSNCLLK